MTGRFGAGFLVGILLSALIGLAVGGDSDEAATTTSPASTTIAVTAAPWFEASEVMIGATAILPRELTIDGRRAFFDYELTGLSPTLSDEEHEERPDLATPGGDHMAMPEQWLLTTDTGQTIGATTGPFDTSVSFDLPAEGDVVASLAVTGWRVAVPFGERIELPIAEGATGEMRRGTVTIETVLEQTVSTIVQIDFDRNGDSWDADVSLRPLDTRWRVSGRQGGGLQLIWEGDAVPASVILEDGGFEMRPVTGEIMIPIPGGS